MIKVEEIKGLYNFEPKYTFSQLEQNLPQRFEAKIQDSRLYKAVERLTDKVYPTEESSYEKKWFDFYLPLKRRGYFILVPLGIVLYDKRFFLAFPHSNVEVLYLIVSFYSFIDNLRTLVSTGSWGFCGMLTMLQ